MKDDISSVASFLVSTSSWNNCSYAEAWEKHISPLIKSCFSFDEIYTYIENMTLLGASVEDENAKVSNEIFNDPDLLKSFNLVENKNISKEDQKLFNIFAGSFKNKSGVDTTEICREVRGKGGSNRE